MHIRKAENRGHFQNNWLNSWHTFSFSSYFDPKYMNFSHLRVLNDDIIQPYQGFGFHPHKDMEIITFMLSGNLEHRDSLGNRHLLKRGNVQLMRAGTGIIHSEMNPTNEVAHLLQIWIPPIHNNLEPGWWEKSFIENRNIVLVEPTIKTHSIQKLSNSLSGNGLNMDQNGYILSINEETSLDFNKFGKSDIYIHNPTTLSDIQYHNESWTLQPGDALFETNIEDIVTIKPSIDPVLCFIFPK